MQRVLTLSDSEQIGPEHLNIEAALPSAPASVAAFGQQPSFEAGTSIRELERRLLETTLNNTGGNRTRAAELLGVSLRTIRNKIREYGLPPRRYA
jgi:DNA-binding NtrC family response regulator